MTEPETRAPQPIARRGGHSSRNGLLLLLFVTCVAAPLLGFRLGARSLEGDEAIYGEVVREALAGSWSPLRFDKQPFPYPQLKLWASAAVAAIGGTGEASLRSVDAALGLATVLLLQVAGTQLLGRSAATVAALLLLTLPNLLFVHGLRDCGLDAAVLFLTSSALLYYGVRRISSMERASPLGRRDATTVVGAGVLFGAACWTKFPVPVLGILVLVAWELAVAPRGARLRGAILALATGAVALLVYLPSPALLWAELGRDYTEFLHWHLVERAAGQVSAGSSSPFYYLGQLASDFGPALALAGGGALAGLWRCRQGDRLARALALPALWAFVVLAFFQAIPARNVWYLYPAYPALALLAGGAVAAVGTALRSRFVAGARLLVILVGLYLLHGVAGAWAKVVAPADRSDPHRVADFLRAEGRPAVCRVAGSNLEAWDYFYLLPVLERPAANPRRLQGCEYLVTSDPGSALPPGTEEGRVRWLQSFSVDQRPIALVSWVDELPFRVRALGARSQAALWGRVRLAGQRSEGELLASRYWRARERWGLAAAGTGVVGPPMPGVELWHRMDEPLPAARVPFEDAWLPGGQEVALIVSGLDLSPLRLFLQPWPKAETEPQLVRIATREEPRRSYRLMTAGPVEIELTLKAADLDGDLGTGRGRLALGLWSAPWSPRWEVPGSSDARHLGVRLLAIRQVDREIWRLPEVPRDAIGRPVTEEEPPR